ncbi:MAG: hypothetical protein AAB426_14370 [Myxococcota bacterium]
MLETSYNDWALVSLSPLSFGTKALLTLALGIAVVLVLWSYRQARGRLTLMTLRVLGALLVAGLILEPAVQLRVVRRVRSRVPIIVDRSASMALPNTEGHTRYDELLRAWHEHAGAMADLAQSHVLELFDLDAPLASVEPSSAPAGRRTDLVTALEQAREGGSSAALAGFMLLSDGADNVAIEATGEPGLSAAARERLTRLGAPINTVLVGGETAYRDVAIADLTADEFAFVHNTLEVEVDVAASGIDAMTLPVTLRRENEVVATQEAALRAGETTHITFKMKPDKIGEFLYSVSVAEVSGEAVLGNNTRAFALRVIRDKIRVLQVAGRPSWDERFLRQHLKEDPNIDLISFFILRTPTDTQAVDERELSLIPFPTQKLFTTELASFDVVMLQNFDYRPYNMAPYLTNIRDAVHRGLGFAMVGGEQSFAGGGYAGTALEDILALRADDGNVRDEAVAPALTAAGKVHPVTDLARGALSSAEVWATLPSWGSTNTVPGLAPGASALVTHPRLRGSDGLPLPLVAVRDVEHGRSLAIATDSLWRWRFDASSNSDSAEQAYHRFWSNALHWLVRDPQHSRVQVLPGKRRVEPDEPVTLGFSVRGADYQPVALAKIHVVVSEGTAGAVRGEELTTNEQGGAELRLVELEAGAYRVTAEARGATGPIGTGSAIFLVDTHSPELSRPTPRADLMQAIADATGGSALRVSDDFVRRLHLRDPQAVEVDRRRNVELWDNGWALTAAVLLLAGEWALRRRRGYV